MSATVQAPVDIIRAEIIKNALQSAALEMNKTLIRSAYNPLIFDVKDFGVGIASATGELWSDAPGLPVFTGVLPASFRTGIAKHGLEGFTEGDVLVVNSPFENGTHISDTAVYMPVFFEGELISFTGAMAHWADVGGMSPGGWTVDSTSIYQEGIRFTHQRLFNAGEPNHDILDLIKENMRVSDIVMGDVYAMIATCRTGAERVQTLCRKYGAQEVIDVMGYILEQTETALRRELTSIPDVVKSASVRLDFDGVDREYEPVLSVQTRIEGDRMIVSFEGTSGIASGPINAGSDATAAAVAQAAKGLLDPIGPANQAHLNIVEFEWPEEPSILSPVAPAPCDSYGYVLTALTEIIQHSFADLVPQHARAGGYQMVSTYVMSSPKTKQADSYVFAEPVQGGLGAFEGHDGACQMFAADGDASNTPVEIIEMRYPILVDQFSLRPDSAGAGEYRGGMGVNRHLRVLAENSLVKTASENYYDPISRGAKGGRDGKPSHFEFILPSGEVEVHPERTSDAPIAVGSVVCTRTGGGGGYGDPALRDPQAVARDARDEYITVEEAASVYRVSLLSAEVPGGYDVDEAGTEALRASAGA